MISIEKNTVNTVILTLTEKSSLVNPYYLFEFRNDLTFYSTYFTAQDTSSWKGRYNEFTITETAKTSVDLFIGKINLTKGKYTYKIWQQNSPTNILPTFSGISQMVETGIAIVYGDDDLINNLYK